ELRVYTVVVENDQKSAFVLAFFIIITSVIFKSSKSAENNY
ncbi:MAG: hypothetical protein ACI9MD_001992, partial [Psychrobacter glaciei]